MDASNLRIKRVIVEAKYNGVLSYARLREELFDRWVKDFARIGVSDSSIEIIDTSRCFKVFSEWNRSGLYFENVENPSDYIKKTSEYLGKLLAHYKRTELLRIGNRFEFILEYKEPFEKLFTILKANIYKEKVDELGEIVDFGTLALTAKDGDHKIKISLGPMRKHEITQRNEFGFEQDPDVALFLDIDYYSDVKKEYELEEFIQKAWKFADNRSKQFIKSIS